MKEKHERKASKKNRSTLNEKLSVVTRMLQLASQQLDDATLLKKIMAMVMKVSDTMAGSIFLVDRTTKSLIFKVALGKKAGPLANMRINMNEGIAGWVAKHGRPVIANNVKADPRFSPKISRLVDYKTENILCIPLKYKGKTCGVIEVINKKNEQPFTAADRSLLGWLGVYVAMVVENSTMVQDMERQLALLNTLQKSAMLLNSTLNLKELLKIIMETTTKVLDAEASSIFLIDQDTKELVADIATGPKKEEIKQIRVPFGSGVVGWVASKNEPLLIADAQNDKRFFKKADDATKFVTRSIAAVPLSVGGKVTGVVEVLNKKGNSSFSKEDEKVLLAIADQSAIVIDNAKLYKEVQDLFFETVTSLARAIEAKDVYTRGHSERVMAYSLAIAEEMGLEETLKEEIRLGALLHDVGKIGVPEKILSKPAALTPEERAEVEKHPLVGVEIVKPVKKLLNVINCIRYHHERFDGQGYPEKLRGEKIPIQGRILTIADSFDAMTSDRPYRKGMPYQIALQRIIDCVGTQFDPKVVGAFQSALEKGKIIQGFSGSPRGLPVEMAKSN